VTTSGPTEDVSALMAVSANSIPAANDGGALVDGGGSVIGITSSLQSSDPSQQGLAFAVPIDVARHVADQLVAGATPTHPWLGITGSGDLARPTAQAMGLRGGAQVVDVDDSSPASAANLRPNDVITDFDGQPVASTGALAALLNRCSIGQKTPITYQRAGKVINTSIRVAEQPGDTDAASSSSP
ncbi:MAG: S1C family serine protease, partial [Actinomycetes bacterium]